MDSLTKEHFWNKLMEKYPEGMKHFCTWVDKYKKKVDWNYLFNSQSDYQNADGKNAPSPKYHDLPIAMQTGIFLLYISECKLKDGFDVSTITKADNFSNIQAIIPAFFALREQTSKSGT